MAVEYNGGLTREQFLFFEIRIVSSLLMQGLSRIEIIDKIKQENLAHSSADVAKQINLYAMMKYNRIVWDFMTTVIGEKFRTQEFEFSRKDLNLFFFRLQEQNDSVASWSDSTIKKIKQVLTKSLVECEYLNSGRATQLNPVSISPELEDEIRAKNDLPALAAFNCFR